MNNYLANQQLVLIKEVSKLISKSKFDPEDTITETSLEYVKKCGEDKEEWKVLGYPNMAKGDSELGKVSQVKHLVNVKFANLYRFIQCCILSIISRQKN